MVIVGAICGLLFVGLGIYGGMCAYSRWVRGAQGCWWVFESLPAMYFGLALMFTLIGAIAGFRLHSQWNDALLLLELALFPFGMLGAVLWVFGLGMEAGARAMAPSEGPLPRTFDRGDGCMARGAFLDAEREFRAALTSEPGNLEALLRLCRALEAGGKLREAAAELSMAHNRTIDHRNDPPPANERWQERLLSVTFALGDLYSNKLDDPGRARQLYQTTLEYLYGYRDADPLRARLKRLEHGLTPINATIDPLPERLPLE